MTNIELTSLYYDPSDRLVDGLQWLEGSSLSVLLAGMGETRWCSHKDQAYPGQAGRKGLLKISSWSNNHDTFYIWHLPTVGVSASGLFMIVTALAEVAPVVIVVGGSLSAVAAPASPSPPSCFSFSPSLSLDGELSSVSPGSSSLEGWVGS